MGSLRFRQRVIQHKPQRENSHLNEVQDLKAENRTLRKQLSRLRKELNHGNPKEDIDEEPQLLRIVDNNPRCAKCNGNKFKSLALPTGTVFTACTSCGTRLTPR